MMKKIFLLVYAFLTILSSIITVPPLQGDINSTDIINIILLSLMELGILWYFYKKTIKLKLIGKFLIAVFVIIFSVVSTLSKSFALFLSIEGYQNNFSVFILQFAAMVIVSLPVFILMHQVLLNGEGRIIFNNNNPRKSKYFTLFIFLSFLIIWLGIAVCFYPGNLSNDAIDQLSQFASITNQYSDASVPLNNHHPIIDTFIMGSIFTFGKTLFNSFKNSIFFLVIIQTVLNSLAFGLIIDTLFRSKLKNWIAYVFWIAMLFSPIWINLNITVVKDTIFIAPFIYWFYLFAKIIFNSNITSKRDYLIFIILSILVSLMRPNSFYVVILSVIFLPLLNKNMIKRFKLFMVPVFILMFILPYNSIIKHLEIIPASPVEMLSLPLQQSARTLIEHGDEISIHDKKIINLLYPVNQVKQRYNPQVSDPIKGAYSWEGKNTKFVHNFKKFIPVWASLGVRYPLTYFEATFANSFGYLDVWHRDSGQGQILFPQSSFIPRKYHYFGELLSLKESNNRGALTHFTIMLMNKPIISIYHNIGLWSWLVMFIFVGNIFYKNWRNVLLILPALLTLGTILLSPVNGLNRYFVPIFLMIPLILAFYSDKNNLIVETRKKHGKHFI